MELATTWFNLLHLIERNEVYKPLAFLQSCESLAWFEKSKIKVLSVAIGYKCSAKEIVIKVDCVMNYSTAFIIRVFDTVCRYMEAERFATFVSCNMHIIMIFYQELKKYFSLFIIA